jgi:acetyl esterase/lipase
MSRQQWEAIEAAMRAEPLDLTQGVDEHRKRFDEFAIAPYPPDVTAREVTLGGVGAIELAVAGSAAEHTAAEGTAAEHTAAEGTAAGGTAAGGVTVLYFHGGGYVVGSARTGARLAAELARRSGGRALSVDYRLAPEHPHPAAVQDAIAAYAGLLDAGADPAHVVLAGDSAGGGLAVAALLAARDRGLPQSAACVVFSPWADITRSGVSYRGKDRADALFSYDAISWYAAKYVPDGDQAAPLASPVSASLAGLPPLLIQVGSHEVLLDDSLRLAANAARDDVEVTLTVAQGAPHVFVNRFGQVREADDALDEAARFIARHAT